MVQELGVSLYVMILGLMCSTQFFKKRWPPVWAPYFLVWILQLYQYRKGCVFLYGGWGGLLNLTLRSREKSRAGGELFRQREGQEDRATVPRVTHREQESAC